MLVVEKGETGETVTKGWRIEKMGHAACRERGRFHWRELSGEHELKQGKHPGS